MADPRPIVCGGLPLARKERGVHAVRLKFGRGRNDVRLRLDRVSADLQTGLTDLTADLLEVAAYVYAADQAVTRGGTREFEYGDHWRRHLRFRIPVRCPQVWNRPAVSHALRAALDFAADDRYEFEFLQHHHPPDPGRLLTDTVPADAAAFDEVVLFSGGLDSLAGAADEVHAGRRVVLVSHNPESRVTGRQRDLATALSAAAPGDAVRPYHLQVEVNKGPGLNREFTQRTRSFLFAAFGAVAARQLGLNRIRFYENGVTSLNLPVNGDLVGARASRTTHPRTLAGYGSLFSHLFDTPVRVDNPFLWRTKAEVIGRLRAGGHADLIRVARSCASTWTQTAEHPHCGRCSQCVDRRLAVIAAGLTEADPADGYASDVITGERNGSELTFVERYTGTAFDLEHVTDARHFTELYPQLAWAVPHLGLPADEGAERVFDLHRRHAAGVRDAVARSIADHSAALSRQAVPARSLLGVVLGRVPPTEGGRTGGPVAPPQPNDRVVVDRAGFSVRCDGRVCFLGNTVEFRLAERLLRARGQYLSLDTLRADVWENPRTEKNTVQRTVSNLRRRLRDDGLAGVELDGSQRGHYCLRHIATAPAA